jgi:hypothetical protein
LDGLLQIDPILALPTGANRPIASTSDWIGNPQLVTQHVRIDMGQMVQLKEMGYEVSGPVNGPNEGLPEFEVPEHWLKSLTSEPPLMPNKSPRAIPGNGVTLTLHSALNQQVRQHQTIHLQVLLLLYHRLLLSIHQALLNPFLRPH